MIELLVKAGLAYLLGTVLGGALLARLRGFDLRKSGSGNVGATNALRAGGWRLAAGQAPKNGVSVSLDSGLWTPDSGRGSPSDCGKE